MSLSRTPLLARVVIPAVAVALLACCSTRPAAATDLVAEAGRPPAAGATARQPQAARPAARGAGATKGPVVKIGAAAADQAAFDAFDRQAGRFAARRTYSRTVPRSFAKSPARTDVAAHRTSYWSFKPDPKTFPKDKKAQRALSRFLSSVPKGHQLVVIAWHEPEDEIRAHRFTLKQWARTNDVVGKIVHSKHRKELRHGICLMGPWTFDSRSPYYGYRWDKVLTMKYVDVVGIDPYKFRTSDPSLGRMLTASNSGNGKTPNPSVMTKLRHWKKPVAIMEFGVNAKDRYTGAAIPDAARARWLRDAASWMAAWNGKHRVKIEAAVYFQLHPGGPYLTGPAVEALDAMTG